MDNNIVKEYCKAIKERLQKGDYISAINVADRLVYNFPNCDRGYYYRGVCLFGLEKIPEAISNYSAALKLNPFYAKAYFNLGVCYQKIQYYDNALINFGKALILFTNNGKNDAREKVIDAIQSVDFERKNNK